MPKANAAIIIHSIDDARAAFKAASDLGVALTLQSAPHAIFYAGGLYLLTLFQQAQSEFPDVAAIFILDCGDAGAETVSAMHMGHKHIRSSALAPLFTKLHDIAQQLGVQVITTPFETIDIRHDHNPIQKSKEWLVLVE